MDIINLSREAKKLRRWLEVFQHAEEVLQEEAVADEKLRGIRAEQAKVEMDLQQAKEQKDKIVAQALGEQKKILEKAEEEKAMLIAGMGKERESLVATMKKEEAKLLAEIETLKQQLSETKNYVATEKIRLTAELESTQSRHQAVLEGLRNKEHTAREATLVAEEKLRLAREALANLKANL